MKGVINKRQSQVVAFLDILGFGSGVKQDYQSAVDMIGNYQHIIEQKIKDYISHPPMTYPCKCLKSIAEYNCLSSFSHILPFSDSVFFIGQDPNMFIRQLTSFLYSCLVSNHQAFESPIDKSDPAKVQESLFSLKNGKIKRDTTETHWYPMLFRGGISQGRVDTFDVSAIFKYKLIKVPNLSGLAVVKAVNYEEDSGKGPRLFFDKEFMQMLNKEARYFVRPVQVKSEHERYELLWLGLHYWISKVGYSMAEFLDYFDWATAYWIAFKNKPEVAAQYYAFMRLIAQSCVLLHKKQGQVQTATVKMREHITKGVSGQIADELMAV